MLTPLPVLGTAGEPGKPLIGEWLEPGARAGRSYRLLKVFMAFRVSELNF